MEIIDTYLSYLEKKRKLSENTLLSYKHDLYDYLEYLTSNKLTITGVRKGAVTSYFSLMQREGKSVQTIARAMASIRGMYKYLNVIERMKRNPTDGIAAPKSERKLPEILTIREVERLLSQPSGDDFKSVRDKAMLELLYATGIKVSELLKVEINDVNLAVGILHLKNGDKERIVPIYPAAVKSLENYILNAREGIIDSESQEILFTNLNGQPMSRQGFWKIIKFYAEKAGIRKDITPQTLRHSFATHLLENGAKLQDIKEMLGHSDISSTQVYAQFVKNKYASKYAKFHPLAK